MLVMLSKSILGKWCAKFVDFTDTFQEMGDCIYYKVTTCTSADAFEFETIGATIDPLNKRYEDHCRDRGLSQDM